MRAHKFAHLVYVGRFGHHELEPCTPVAGVRAQHLGHDRLFACIARMRELGANIELVDPYVELRRGQGSTVGFDLHRHIGQRGEQLCQRRRLQHRLAPGDH